MRGAGLCGVPPNPRRSRQVLRAGAQRKWEPFQELLEVYVGNSLWERRGLRGRAGRWQMGVPRAIAACSSPSGSPAVAGKGATVGRATRPPSRIPPRGPQVAGWRRARLPGTPTCVCSHRLYIYKCKSTSGRRGGDGPRACLTSLDPAVACEAAVRGHAGHKYGQLAAPAAPAAGHCHPQGLAWRLLHGDVLLLARNALGEVLNRQRRHLLHKFTGMNDMQ